MDAGFLEKSDERQGDIFAAAIRAESANLGIQGKLGGGFEMLKNFESFRFLLQEEEPSIARVIIGKRNKIEVATEGGRANLATEI
jgi:hypothetical protein